MNRALIVVMMFFLFSPLGWAEERKDIKPPVNYLGIDLNVRGIEPTVGIKIPHFPTLGIAEFGYIVNGPGKNDFRASLVMPKYLAFTTIWQDGLKIISCGKGFPFVWGEKHGFKICLTPLLIVGKKLKDADGNPTRGSKDFLATLSMRITVGI